jgi:hypothetical protein
MGIEYRNVTVKGSSYHILLEQNVATGKPAGIIVANDGYVVGTASYEIPPSHQEQIKLRDEGKLLHGNIGGDALIADWSLASTPKKVSDYLTEDPAISAELKGALGLLGSMQAQKALAEPRAGRRIG